MSDRPGLVVDWTAGPHHGLAWPRGVALVDGAVPHDVVRRVWTAMLAPGAGLPVLLAALGEGPTFAAAIDAADDTSHLVARGDAAVTASAEGGDVFLSGAGRPRLQERWVRLLRTVALTSGTVAVGSARPLGSGVVPAGAVERTDPSSPVPVPVPVPTFGVTAQVLSVPPAGAAPTIVGAPPAVPVAEGPATTLLGVLCRSGHANPPLRTACRVCADPIGGPAQHVPRPPLGIARLSTGADLALAGPIVIGRDPRASRFQGTEVPRLVQLPHKHVSASHLELRVDGWQVLASDLHSTNGTYLRRGGEPPARLTETPLVLASEDVLDLGHGVHIRFLELP